MASTPLAAMSTVHPSVSSNRTATRWLTTLSSATKMRARGSDEGREVASCARASMMVWRVTNTSRAPRRLTLHTAETTSASCDGRVGLVRYASKPTERRRSASPC
jgi:hypothetical protein